MGLKLALVFGLLSVVAASHHKGVGFVPVGKELVYDYKTIVRSGTLEPAYFASEYMIRAKLHVQGGQNSTFVRLTDIKYKVHNGEAVLVDRVPWGEDFVPIPEQAVDLTYPFVVQYDHEGKAVAMATEEIEKKWSRNIKQSIASIMQLDMTEIEKELSYDHAFFTPEQTIYGECDVSYNVMPRGEKTYVTKFQEPSKCHDKYDYHWSNKKSSACDTKYENPLTSDSNRRYVLSKQDGAYFIERVSATGTIYSYPFRAQSEMFFVHTNQTMTFYKTFDIKEQIVVKEQHWVRGFRYIAPQFDESTGAIMDLTQGRKVLPKMDELMPKMRSILGEVLDYFDDNHIDMKAPDVSHIKTVNHLLFMLMQFDLHSLEHCFVELQAKTESHDVKLYNIFLQMLPRIGTKASTTFLRNIIRKNKIKESEAVEILMDMPFYVRYPTEKFLAELEDMMTLGGDSYSLVRRAGILGFATFVHKTFEHTYDDKHVSEVLDRYVKMYFEKMRTATEYKIKMMWMEGLHNIQFPIVVRYLEPIIRGEEKVSDDLRFLAIWASMSTAIHDPHYAYKLFWPILSDRKQTLEMRVAAYTILMSSPHSMDRYLNIYWLMRHEPNEALYHFHYTTLQSLSKSKHSCFHDMGLYAKRLLRMSRKPIQNEFSNGNYIVDYVDSKYGFGCMYQMLTLATPTTQAMFGEVTTQLFNRPYNLFSFFIKIKNLDNTLRSQFPVGKVYGQSLNDIQSSLKKVIKSTDEDLHVEVMLLAQGQVRMTYFFDMSNIDKISDVFGHWEPMESGNELMGMEIMYDFLGHSSMATDFGVPAMLSAQMPSISAYKMHIGKEQAPGASVLTLHGDMSYKYWTHGSYFMDVYNPINDLWHCVKRVHLIEAAFPLKFDIVFNPEQLGTIRFSLKHWDDKHVFGFKNHVQTITYLYGDTGKEVLRTFDKEAHVYETVTKGKQYKNEFMLFDKEVYDIGSKVQVGVFDCEQPISRGSLMTMLKEMSHKYDSDYEQMPFTKFFLTVDHLFSYIYYTPTVGSCGFTARVIPSVEKPVDHIDFAFRFNLDVGKDSHVMLPEAKINSRLTTSYKGVGGDVLRTWDFTFLLDMDKGHDDNKYKMIFVRTVPGHDEFKMNVEGEKKWENEAVAGKTKITFTEGDKESYVEVDMKGEISEDQKRIITDKYYTYDECIDFPMYHHEGVVKHDLSCDVAETSIRKYVYDFKIHNMECPYIKNLMLFKKIWRANHAAYYKIVPIEKPVGKDHFRLEVEYPVHRDEVDLHATYPEYSVEYTGVPMDNMDWWNWFGLDNFHYSKFFMMMHKFGIWNTCIVHEHQVHKDLDEIVDHEVTSDWTVYAEQTIETSKFILKVKKVEGSRPLAIRIEEDEHWLEIVPHGDHYTFTEEGKVLSDVETGYHHEKWYSYKVIKEQHDVLLVTDHGMHLDFDGKTVRIDFTVGEPVKGFCFA